MAATTKKATGLIGIGVLLLASAVVRAQTASGSPSLTDCLSLGGEGEIRSCADKYISIACRPPITSPSLLTCLKARAAGGGVDLYQRTEAGKANYEACRAEKQEFERAHDPVTCANAVRVKTAARVNAETSCTQFGQLSACLTLLPEKKVAKACGSQCINARVRVMNEAASQEQGACESRYVEADGRGRFACSLAGAIANVDTAKLESDLEAAQNALDGAALDASIKQSEGQFLDKLQTRCTKACNERAPHLLAVQKQGPVLVTVYKRCMVAADSTLEARKLNAYEVDLYCDYVHKADAKCRTASRCDWIEQYSSLTCNYASPGVNCP